MKGGEGRVHVFVLSLGGEDAEWCWRWLLRCLVPPRVLSRPNLETSASLRETPIIQRPQDGKPSSNIEIRLSVQCRRIQRN
jgi:hypothetical protein